MNRWRVRIVNSILRNSFGFYLLKESKDGSLDMMKSFEIENIPYEDRVKLRNDEPVFNLSEETCQEIVDELWNLGFRARQGHGSVGQLGAVEKHLESVEKVKDRLLSMIEGKWNEDKRA